MNLNNKVAIVTGGSRGIGAGICKKLAEAGSKVVINYKNGKEQAGRVLDEIEQSGGTVEMIKADIGNIKDVKYLFNKTLERFRKIDILVNNAAVCKFSDLFDITEELWDETQNINIKGHFFLSQYVSKHMVENNIKGRIITISSIGALVGTLRQAHYCTTKAAGSNMMKSMAVILGPHGITCNTVLPGTIETDINRNMMGYYDSKLKQIPSRRIGQPEDVAGIVTFLASDEAGYINGTDILVDGGRYINGWYSE